MKGKNIFDAMSFIDAELIEKADKAPKKAKKNVYVSNKRHKNRWISSVATAMIALMICSVVILNHILYPGFNIIGDETTTFYSETDGPIEDTTTIPDSDIDDPVGDTTTIPDSDIEDPVGDTTTIPDSDIEDPVGDTTTIPDSDIEDPVGDTTTIPDSDIDDPNGDDTITPGGNVYIPNDTLLLSYSLASPSYPITPENTSSWKDFEEKRKHYYAGKNLTGFFKSSTQLILGDVTTENAVYSPVNVYMSLAMLAEISSGNTRNQIMNALNANSIKGLRTQANSVWNACYRDDNKTMSRMANSIWLNKNVKNGDCSALAQNYYASVFSGDMSNEEYAKAYTEWLKKETGGLLNDVIDDKKFDRNTIMALASTLYFKASWNDKFDKELTKTGVFHSPTGDIMCDFMNEKSSSSCYYGEMFSATYKALGNDGNMYFILPNENVSISELLSNDEALTFISNTGDTFWKKATSCQVNLSLPKFDVSMKKDIIEDIKALGITDCFDIETANFSEFFPENQLFINEMEHGVRVSVDEESCSGAAYVHVATWGGYPPSEVVDFTLDRPFIFVVTGPDGLPLFIGVVNNPN